MSRCQIIMIHNIITTLLTLHQEIIMELYVIKQLLYKENDKQILNITNKY